MADAETRVEPHGTFRPLRLIVAVLAVMLAISAASRWYARDVTLPRYCEDPEQALADLRRVLTEERPAGDGARRPFIVAARLMFLVPRNGDEPLRDYLGRLRIHMAERCP
ncbi:MAG: hypothetical protein U9Q81_23775 [Pseudomonadota bacterium]|nr:hypothetical protein [Pseudomonadota bacterium]